MSPVNTELSGFTVRAGRGFSGSDSDAGLSSLIDVIHNGHIIVFCLHHSYLFYFFISVFYRKKKVANE